MYSKIAVVLDPGAQGRKAGVDAGRLSELLEADVTALRLDTHPDQPVDVPFEVQVVTGRPHRALKQALHDGEFDLMVLRATGSDEPRHGDGIGPLAERSLRTAHVDTLVVKTEDQPSSEAGDTIMVCMDGSIQAFAGLKAAFELSRRLDKKVEAVAVYDPYLHYTLFNGIVGVLSEEASSVFKFADQEKLHEEIIDTGLAKIYQAHLDISMSLAREDDIPLTCTLLDGKAFQKLLRHANKRKPYLMIVGRIGVHSDQGMDIGATTENLLRHAPCDVLVTSRTFQPPVDIEAQANVEWSPEALEKIARIPSFVKGVATTAILRWAKERGHSIITASVINSAMGDLLPEGAARAMGYDDTTDPYAKGEALRQELGLTFVCNNCGHVVRDARPTTCGVCSSENFHTIDRAAAEATKEAVDVEEAFDGRKLSWESGAKSVLRRVPSGYQRRRSKARIEKSARVRGLKVITEAFAIDVCEQDLAETSYLTARGETLEIEIKDEERPNDEAFVALEGSELRWTAAAITRLERVPEGFMRDMTRDRIEQFAGSRGATDIDLTLCEEGIAEGRRMMAQALGSYDDAKDAMRAMFDKPAAPAHEPKPVDAKLAQAAKSGGCPVHEADAEAKAKAAASAGCPMHQQEHQTADPEWTERAEARLESAKDAVTAAGKFSEQRAEELGRGVAEVRAREKMLEQIGESFMAKLGKQLGYGHPLAQITSELQFEWTPEAEAELEEVPAFCREMTKWRVEWTAHKKNLGTVITPEIMAVKYDMWGEVSDGIIARGDQALPWDDGPTKRIAKIPGFVKGQVIQSVEGNARRWGYERVTDELMDRVIQKWIETGDFHEGKYGYK